MPPTRGAPELAGNYRSASPSNAVLDDGSSYDDDSVFYDDDGGVEVGLNPLPQNLPSAGTAHMEYRETTKDRAQKTLSAWNLHVPALVVGGLGPTNLETLIAGVETDAQARTSGRRC